MNLFSNIIDIFSHHFQSNFEMKIDDRIIKNGKFINIQEKDCFVKLLYTDRKHDKIKSIELPVPYKITTNNNEIIFDYTLKTLCGNNENLMLNIKKIRSSNHSIFYNKNIVLKFDI